MNRKIILLLDENVYENIINSNIDIKIFEKLAEFFGPICLINSMHKNLSRKIFLKDIDNSVRILFNTLMKLHNDEYNKIIDFQKIDKSDYESLLNFLSNNSISAEDKELFNNAKYLSELNYHPVIITTDSDLLTICNIVSSYFGIFVQFMSLYEILRILDKDGLQQYCMKEDIFLEITKKNRRDIDGEKLKNHFITLFNNCHIGFHPILKNKSYFSMMTNIKKVSL